MSITKITPITVQDKHPRSAPHPPVCSTEYLMKVVEMNEKLVHLEDVAIIAAGGGAPQGPSHFGRIGHPFVRAGSLPELVRGKKEEDLEHIDTNTAAAHGLKVFPSNTVLFAKSGMSAMKGHIYVTQSPCYVVNHLAAITPKDRLDVSYLGHWFRVYPPSILVRDEAYPSIRLSEIAQLEIPLPPLAEQKRIAALLDEADALRRKRRAALAKLDALLQSVFLDMFGDPVTNPKGWPRRTISAFGDVITGNTPSREQSKYYGGQLEWIKSDNINTPLHYLTTAQEYLSDAGRKVSRVVPTGSILVTCIAGSPDCIGNAAIANREVAFNQQINAIIPHEKLDTFFLYTQLLVAKRLVQNVSTNSMKGMVNKSAFSQIELICPHETLRWSFSDVFSQIHLQSDISRNALAKSEALFAAFEQVAFSSKATDTQQPHISVNDYV